MDRLRTTGESHHRCMVAEVMGRHVGWIALHSGLGAVHGGDVVEALRDEALGHHDQRGASALVDLGDPTGIETRNTILGHIQRGGAPTGYDRVLATRFGMRPWPRPSGPGAPS
jgi:6-phosphofructokinase